MNSGKLTESAKFIIESDKLDFGEFQGIGYELFKSMKKFSDSHAQYILKDDTKETYGVLLQKSIRTALKLSDNSLGDNPIIGICVNNHSNSCIPFIASMFLGYRVVTFNGTVVASDTSFLLEQVTPTLMFIDKEFLPMMEAAMQNIGANFNLVVFGGHDKYDSFDEYLVPNTEENKFTPIKVDDNKKTAVILFSSGTTGLSKGICLNHKGIIAKAYYMGYYNKFSSNTIFYYFTTLNWVTSVIFLIATALYGTARVISPIEGAIEAINKYKVENIFISPFLSSLLVKESVPSNVDLSCVKYICTSGTRLSESLRQSLQNLFPNSFINQTYGQTETTGWITVFPYVDERACFLARKNPDSVGIPTFGFSYKVVDTEIGTILGPNQIGHLHVKAQDVLMNGYYNKDSTDEYDDEGWLKTGDLGYFDEDNCLFMTGRCKELLKYRGFHIQPQKIEAIIETHPAVDKVVISSIHHEIDGDHLVGLVIVNKNCNITPKDIEELVAQNLEERYRLRGGVKIVETLPFTSTGKLRRTLIKQMLEKGEL